ncbi:hypothetical protein V8F20_009206 [Naviculisporaceae sp. PSN 640]
MYLSKNSLSPTLLLLINLLLSSFNTTRAASILKRDPSTLINIRHPDPDHGPDADADADTDPNNRLIISGHGVIAIPIPPTGDPVQVDVNPSPINDDQTPKTTDSSDPDSEYIKLVKVGDTTFQIIGTELTITDNREGSPQPGDVGDGGNGGGGPADQKLTPGQMAAMEFAKTAEEIAAGNDRVKGGT